MVHEGHLQAAEEQARRWVPELVILAAELALRGQLLELLSSLDPRPAVLLTERMDRFDRAWRAWQKGGDELLLKPMLSTHDLHLAIVAARENATGDARRRGRVRTSASA